jgi:MYXO-CTERM domain-containing protein
LTGGELEVAAVAVVVVGGIAGRRRRRPLDPQRAFSAAQRAEALARCGNRCEHFGALGLRCRRRATHADHIHPWSKGGATTAANLEMLCPKCNLSKGAKMPPPLYAWRLERRRRRYRRAG